MRGSDEGTGALFSYVDIEARIRRDHPLRQIRQITNTALSALDGDFEALYPRRLGRPSIPPERLLRAMLLQVFYGLRSERQLMERIERSEEHTSELQSLMRISYAVLCLHKKNN